MWKGEIKREREREREVWDRINIEMYLTKSEQKEFDNHSKENIHGVSDQSIVI